MASDGRDPWEDKTREIARADRTEKEVGQYVYDTCIFFGCAVSTAHTVAGMFLRALEREKSEKRKPECDWR